ncbi:hypothetical protein T484DRAFT_3093477 [Baffinella frigidus]|nr:hypothetical protein T484DRAFT_3093477 [Cryptophyta sp. CCMP2293]
MGQCFSAKGVEGLNAAGGPATRRPGQTPRPAGGLGAMGPSRMGPDDIENQLFQNGGTGPLFPQRTPDKANTGQRTPPGEGPAPPFSGPSVEQQQIQDAFVSAEVGNLNDLNGTNKGAGEANGATPAKKTVMRRSFPPVGVKLVLDQDFASVAGREQRAAFEDTITSDFAELMGAEKQRFRVVNVQVSLNNP